jgi:hypothetical protein
MMLTERRTPPQECVADWLDDLGREGRSYHTIAVIPRISKKSSQLRALLLLNISANVSSGG